jgi:hypothetical protein
VSAHNKTHLFLVFLAIFLGIWGLVVTGCQGNRTVSSPTPSRTGVVAPTNLPTPTEIPTATPQPPLALLIAPPGVDSSLVDQVKALLTELSTQSNLEFQTRAAISKEDLSSNLRLVVVLGTNPGLIDLAGAAPTVQFLGIGLPGVKPTQNVSLVSSWSNKPDQLGFLAGFLAAVVTPDWRVGILIPKDSPDGNKAQQGFIKGVTYYCGLCRPAYPPFNEYPIYIQSQPKESSENQAAIVNLLIQQEVQTVYVFPGAGDETLFERLAQQGINLIGGIAPAAVVQDHWLASFEPDYLSAIRSAWSKLINGQGNLTIDAPLLITHINSLLFSVGRQRLVEELLVNLQKGVVDLDIEVDSGGSQ